MVVRNIKSIKKLKKKRHVYDLSVEDNENFFLTNGVLSHNSGKTVSMLAIAQLYHDHPGRKYKVFDLWGGDRNEHLYWALPSNKINYWKKAQKMFKLTSPGPKQYKVKLLYPMWTKFPKRLPHNPPYVKSQVFTIPFRDIKIEDLALISGPLSSRDEGIWNDVIYELDKKASPSDAIQLMKDKKSETWTIFRNSINPLIRELLLQADNCALNVDIRAEVADQQTVTVLCLDFVPKEFRYFIMGYIIRKITEELDRKRTKTIALIREASEIFRADNAAIIPPRILVLKNYISQWIRMGRRGLHFMLDTQSPAETKGMVGGQQDLSFFGRLPSRADRESATEQLKQDNLITSKQISQMAILEPGQFIVCPSGKKAYFQYFFLPKTRFWEEGNGNFYNNIWGNLVDKWELTRDIIDEMKSLKRLNDTNIQDKIKLQKALAKKVRPQKFRNGVDLNEDIPDEILEEQVQIKKQKEAKALEVVKPAVSSVPETENSTVKETDDWDDLF